MKAHGIYGVVHLLPMLGDPGGYMPEDVMNHALRDAEALANGGVQGIVIENFGSAPFYKGTPDDRIPPHQVAMLTRVAAAVRERFPEPALVMNCLRNDGPAALGITAATGLDAVRINVHVGAYVTDQGLIEGEAAHTLRYRHQLGADVEIWADVLVKHATPLAPLTMEQAIKDCELRGLAQALIVTGTGTGASVEEELLRRANAARTAAPLVIGSGFSVDNCERLAPFADAAIVGTSVKEDGEVSRPVDVKRVKALVERASHLFRGARGSA